MSVVCEESFARSALLVATEGCSKKWCCEWKKVKKKCIIEKAVSKVHHLIFAVSDFLWALCNNKHRKRGETKIGSSD